MADHTQNLALVIDLVRSGQATTRPEIIRQSGLGRAVVQQRVEEALDAGILMEDEVGISTGGRPSPVLRMNADRALVIAAVFGASRLHVALADLAGDIVTDRRVEWDVEAGPAASLEHLYGIVDALMPVGGADRLWGAAIGLPGPVDFSIGAPVQPPLMPGWDGFRVRTAVERHWSIPAWIDNDANLMTLGTWSRTRRASGDNVLFVKAGTGIGAGIISRGRLHRGARGAAGDLGHVTIAEESRLQCRCGKFGCLDAFAGGWALARDSHPAALAGRSTWLQDRLRERGRLDVDDVILGMQAGDTISRELILRAGELIGREVANVVNVLNPSTVYLGGSMVRTGEEFRATVDDAIRRRSLALATDELVITPVPLQHYEGVYGAATLALDELFHPATLREWLPERTPVHLHGRNDGFAETYNLAERSQLLERDELRHRSLNPLPL